MDSNSRIKSEYSAKLIKFCVQLPIALLLITLKITLANQTELSRSQSHLSWTQNGTRFDFVFDSSNTLQNILTLESDSNNYLTGSLAACQNHSACLFQDGKLLDFFRIQESQLLSVHKSVFSSKKQHPTTSNSQQKDYCDQNEFTILHYCSTHWNPPAYMHRNKCSHAIEWHSPLHCDLNSTNYEKPCFIYDPQGNLIDLTPWIKSDGSSYQVDTSSVNLNKTSNKPKEFYINVCNEAHDKCGPNVAACFIDPQQGGLVEAGYNNQSALKYASKEDNAVSLVSLGQIKDQCENSRIKTVIRFVCRKRLDGVNLDKIAGPQLVRSTGCENIIEWETIHACPLGETKTHVLPDCRLRYDPLGIDIDVRQITKNTSLFSVPNIGDPKKKMLIGICKAIPKSLKCEGKETSSTSACLVNIGENSSNSTQIIASISKSTLRLADDRLYFESTAVNKSCSTLVSSGHFNVTRQIGLRVEFYCSNAEQSAPTYLGYDDCSYVFEWGSPLMCFETLAPDRKYKMDASKTKIASLTPDSTSFETLSPKPPTNQSEQANKSAVEQHKETLSDANKINKAIVNRDDQSLHELHAHSEPSTKAPVSASNDGAREASGGKMPQIKGPEPPRMNAAHKFFMISLIIMSLVAFLVIILVLDKKTRLSIPLGSIRRPTRQSFQSSQPIPYSRVVDDLDL